MKQLLNFIIHLRLHYQFFILSGGYLIAALFVDAVAWDQFWLQFINVHVLLFGGATAYNSWWDKDEGPIGGLKSPPKMNTWMWPASLIMQYAGLGWAITVGWNYAIIYAVSMLFFWLYSTPLARWKGKPILSIVAIGISTGTNSFFLGYLAAGAYPISISEDIIALGVAAIILSLYPVSQIYQTDEDEGRGDRTFAVRFGLKGVKWFFAILFLLGATLLSVLLDHQNEQLGMIFGGVTFTAYAALSTFVWKLEGNQDEYDTVMKMKFFASFSFVAFIGGTLLLQILFQN
ncbi:MAG: UbiA prenyltransferase family protein [Gracilimonas sp.]|uniref:UbiA family prenyltransferase n=1 Tax=Gracilimonas TaxID=649462 RepID=UPI001B2DCD75|nr:UbiA family prenyltransferase [Gracilimonas sp.]MBO6586978.1 UbiA prenyltransferase family protein [Gracilimonas sp.]MBO6614534.1 UbiA prenyltransferase family protein [Gracilimonas sp.]